MAPLPLMHAATSAVVRVIAVVAPFLQENPTAPAQKVEISPRRNAPQRTQAQRISIIARDTRHVPVTFTLTSVIIVSPEIATAQIKGPHSLALTGIKAGETILIASDGRRRYTFLIEVVGRSYATTGRTALLEDKSVIGQGGFSGSIIHSFTMPMDDRPGLLSQSFQMRRTLSPGRTLRLSGEMFKIVGQGDRELLRSTTPGFGLNRLSLGLDTPEGTLDILDSQVNVSPLSLNNFTMRGIHLVSTTNSRLRGVELFGGLARPSLSLFDDSRGGLAGIVLPVAQGKSWRVRLGLLAVMPHPDNNLGKGGTVWQIDGRYGTGSNLIAEGEAAYANGGFSWRARLNLRRGPLSAYGEIIRLDGRSPLVSIGAQSGERKTEAFAVQWRLSKRFNASVNYNHTAIAPPATALLRTALDRTTFLASANYQITKNSRLTFRFSDQRFETGVPGGNSRYQLENRTVTVNHSIRFNQRWANNFEGRLNFSREAGADTETERGFYFSNQLRFSWRGGSATGFINHSRKIPSLVGLLVRNPQLLPPLQRRAFLLDPARFLQANRDALAELLPGVELPQTRSLDAGVRLQASFSRVALAAELRLSTGEIVAREQRNILATFSASLKLDAANSLQVSGTRSFALGGASPQSALTVSYVHRFGAGSGGGLQFSRLLGLDRGRIQGRVFSDTNGNGLDDEGESGVPGMRVQIDGSRSAMTDASGRFRFQLNSGEHSVALISNDLGMRLRASTLTEQRVSLTRRQTVNVSFGVSNSGTISGRVFNDLFLMGRPPETNMQGVGGVRMILRHAEAGAGGVAVVVEAADASGAYEFRNLNPGRYILEIDPSALPANFLVPAQASWPITVEPLQSIYLDIPLAAQRAISGIIFIDRDGDGRFDPQKDQPVEGARVSSGRVEASSGRGGSYILRNLPAGIIEIYARSLRGSESSRLHIDLGADPTTRRNINLMVKR